MNAPTADDIRGLSKVNFDELGYASAEPDPLEIVVQQAAEYITYITGRTWGAMPAGLQATATLAVRMRAEQLVYQAQQDAVETAGDIDLIASFSAGAYSETRRDPAAMAQSKGLLLNPWPALNELLWMLLGTTSAFPDPAVDERYDYWISLLTGVHLPAWQVVEVDWAGQHSGGNAIDPYEPWQRYF